MSLFRLSFALACLAACRTEPSASGPEPDAVVAVDAPPLVDGSPWESRAKCQALVASGARAPRTDATALKITTWNVRWFPLGYAPFGEPGGESSDVAWLACTLAWLSPDVVVLQEVLGTAHSAAALEELRTELARLEQRGPWEVLLEGCSSADMQHVAILFRADSRIALRETESFKLSSGASPLCSLGQRPAFVAHYEVDGAPLAVAGLHLKSGRGSDDYRQRRESMDQLAARLAGEDPGERLVLAGDFNSMGCRDCAPEVSGPDEVGTLGAELAGQGLVRSVPAPACTQYTSGYPRVLDHLAVRGTGAGVVARVDGACAELACASAQTEPPAFAHLSDHCPLSIELPR